MKIKTLKIHGDGEISTLEQFTSGTIRRDHVLFVVTDHECLGIEFANNEITETGLIAVRTILRRNPPSVMYVFDNGKLLRQLYGPEAVEGHLSESISARRRDVARFIQQEIDDNHPIWEHRRNMPVALGHIRDGFRQNEFSTIEGALAFIRQLKGMVRYIAYKADATRGDFLFHDNSGDLRDGGTGWFRTCRGMPLSALPDTSYSRWIQASYRGTVERNEAQLHRASIDLRVAPDKPYRQDYYRLTMPFPTKRPGGSGMLLAVTQDVQLAI